MIQRVGARVLVVLCLPMLAAASSAQLTFQPTWTTTSSQAASDYGASVAFAGDVNGDGRADVIVGAPAWSNGQFFEGKAFAYYGLAGGLANGPHWFLESNTPGAAFGTCVAGAGDVNGDGYDDALVGSSQRASLYLGSSSGLLFGTLWSVTSADANFGESLCGAGDLNGDGYDDVVVGAYGADKIFIYHGSASSLPLVPTTTRIGPEARAGFGRSVRGAGDVNGDGYADLIVGAHTYSNPEVNEGAAYVYLGSAGGLGAAPEWSAQGDNTGSLFGLSVSGAGDVDSDGYDDVLVGAQDYGVELSQEGRAVLYRGGASGLQTTPSWSARGQQVNALMGSSVSGAGDVNGDGYDDVVVGASQYNEAPGMYVKGRLFVFLGSAAGPSTVPDWFGPTDTTHAFLGMSVDGGFDVTNDGYDDVIGGGYNFDSGEQVAQVFSGGRHASVAPYGLAKAASPAVYAPRLRTSAAPKLGTTTSIDFSGGAPFGGGVFLFAGLQPAALPFDGGTLNVLPFTTLFLPNLTPSGTFTLPAAIPASPSLQGVDLYLQAGHVDPAAPGSHHTVQSNALHWTLGGN